MKKDATLVYEWSVSDVPRPDEFYFDFHGHTLAAAKDMTVATYEQDVSGNTCHPWFGGHNK